VSGGLVQPMLGTRPSPWAGAVIVKLTPIRSGAPIAFFDVRFPLIEATIIGCTLRRTKTGKLWCAPPKLRRQLPDGTTEWSDFVSWDSGRPASMFNEACLTAIAAHSPELLQPLLEGHSEPAPLALPPQHRDRPPPAIPDLWGDDDR
jgi:hypothetical protein